MGLDLHPRRQRLFVSTISVYADGATPGQDEDAPRLPYAGADVMAETTRDLPAWWDGQAAERRNAALRAGLAAAREAELLRELTP